MGAADVVPGVSGGTVAFITGIYEELLGSIASFKFSLLKTIKNDGIKAAWKEVNGNFLVVLFAGILISILSLAKVFKHLLHDEAVVLWGFFFGLIVASILFMAKQIERWDNKAIIGIVIGTAIVAALSMMPAYGSSDNLLFIFVSGMIAICAMILPGVSGSFILLILGAYATIQTAIADRDILLLAVFAAGCGIGLLAFSRALKKLFESQRNTTMAVLTGFLVGSLYKVWPWKKTVSVNVVEKESHESTQIAMDQLGGKYESLSAFNKYGPELPENIEVSTVEESNVLWNTYSSINNSADHQLLYVVIFALIGFTLVFGMDKYAQLKEKRNA